MPFVYADRVRETSTSIGTGTFALAGAVSGFRTFASGIGANNTCFYTISHRTASEWEVGYGTLDSLGTTLTRTAVQSSSTGSAVVFSAGTKDVFVTIPASALSPISNPNSTGSALQALALSPFGTSAGNTAELRLLELAANGTNYIGFKSPDSIASNLIWTLPNADGANGQVLTTNGSGTLSWAARDYPAQGRLTLTSGVPVTTGDVTAATILYYTPYVGDQIALYNGTTWSILTFSEVSLTLSTIPLGFSGTKPYDIFGYISSGSLAIEGLAWTNETTRATALSTQNGIYIKNGDSTRRYLGTIFPSATSQTEDSAAKRYVWNMYNRVQKHLVKQDSTATWTYGTAAVQRMQNASTANRIDVVCGVIQGILVTHHCDVSVASAATPNITIYYNTSAPSTATTNLGSQIAAGRRGLNANMLSVIHNIGISSSVYCSPGFTCFNALEGINTAATVTFYGSGAQGIYGIWVC